MASDHNLNVNYDVFKCNGGVAPEPGLSWNTLNGTWEWDNLKINPDSIPDKLPQEIKDAIENNICVICGKKNCPYIKENADYKKLIDALKKSDKTLANSLYRTKFAQFHNGKEARINEVMNRIRATRAAGGSQCFDPVTLANIKALFERAGVKASPDFTQQMIQDANAAMTAAGALVLTRATDSAQLSLAGAGTWSAVGDAMTNISGWMGRALSALSDAATSNPVGAQLFAASLLLYSKSAGAGSDKVPGRDLEAVFAMNAQHLSKGILTAVPGAKSVDMPVRGSLINNNGQMALELLKTGNTGLPSAVRVLTAVRDIKTGLDRITIPAVAGTPSRTILINPAPLKPSSGTNTGNQKPVPVTPVHTGVEIKPVDKVVVTTTPIADSQGFRDFIYWRPDAAGTGVIPVYVMLSDPLDAGRFTRKQLDKKFKHAIDFGITDTKKNRETLTKFRDAIESHLSAPETISKGIYRRDKNAKVFYNTKTNRVVILDVTGAFLSGWYLKPGTPQFENFIKTGVL